MNIVVFGASGNIGTRVVERLLKQGDHVTACVHGDSHLADHPNLTSIHVDIYLKEDVERAIVGSDAVVSALGSWGTKRKDVLSAGMKHIIPIMQQHSIQRIISLTGSGVILEKDKVSWYDHLNPLLLRIIGPKILTDGAQHIKLLQDSDLDWTVVRSPVMKNGQSNGYTLQSVPALPWKKVIRDDVADAMVELVHSDQYAAQAPFIA